MNKIINDFIHLGDCIEIMFWIDVLRSKSLTFYNRKISFKLFDSSYFGMSIVENLASAQSLAVTLPTSTEVSGLKKTW